MQRIILTGATGVAGSAVLRIALEDPNVERVYAWTRRTTEVKDAKLALRVHEDFESYDALHDDIRDADRIVWCLGVSSAEVTPEVYERVTYAYTLAAARAVREVKRELVFVFLSGNGADPTEKSRMLFARVKGKTENALANTLPNVICARPGFIRPCETPQSLRTWSKGTFGAAAPLMSSHSDQLVIDDETLARAMLAAKPGDERVLENARLIELGST